ncbi:MAG: hypothetical protein ACLTG4_03800 [Oscillospiraceae bacterium]
MKVISFLLDLFIRRGARSAMTFSRPAARVSAHTAGPVCRLHKMVDGSTSVIPACLSLNYEGNVRESLLRYNGGATGYAKSAVDSLPNGAHGLPGRMISSPAPLSRKRLRERGYDQARLLAKATAKTLACRHADAL